MILASKSKIEVVFEDECSMRHRRNRFESICDPLHYIYSDPPWLAKQLAFTVYDKEEKLNDLICKIKDGFYKCHVKKSQIKNIEDYTKKLGEMISTDPRLGDLLEMDFLKLIVRLLKSQQSTRLQAYAAIILTTVVPFSRNKDDVGVVIQSITPVVLNLICSRDDLVRVKALWLLRNLVFKSSKSNIEEALAPVTSIILEDSIGFGVLRPAAEILLVVCQEHPKLSREKLKLVLPALMKLIESDVLLLLTSGCWGLAHLCDGREEMIVEDKDLKRLIRRLVHIMNWEERATIISGLLSLGSTARWGSDDVIEAIIQDKGSLHILSILLEEGDMYIVKQVCWIISNITARKRGHISAVLVGGIDAQLLNRLVKVVETCTLPDVVKEALWAISNAMCGVGVDQIQWFWDNCNDMYWVKRLIPFLSDKLFVLVFLEGMVKIQAARVFMTGWSFEPIEINSARLHNCSMEIHVRDLLTKCGTLSPGDYAQNPVDQLEFTFQSWDSKLRICYNSKKGFFCHYL